MGYRVRIRRRRFKRSRKSKSMFTTSNAIKAVSLARTALAGVRMLKGLVNSERMYYDRALTLGSNRSLIWGLTLLGQGDNVGQRTGNSILLRSIFIRGFMSINTAVTGHTRVALVLVRDNQQQADTTPTVSEIFEADDPDSMINNETAGRFKIVWRKQYTLLPTSVGQSARDITKYIKVYDHVRYNGTGTSDIQKHGYYLVMLSSESTNYPTISLTSRIGYHDN